MNEGTKVDKVLSVLIEKLTPLLETIKSVEKECSENEEKRKNALAKSIDETAEYDQYASAKSVYDYGQSIIETAGNAVREQIGALKSDLVDIENIVITKGKNLIDNTKLITGYFVRQDTGVLQASSSFKYLDYTPVKPNATYVFSSHAPVYANLRYALYKEDKTFIVGGVGENIITTTADTAFIRLSQIAQYYNYQLELGNVPTEYEEYNEYSIAEEIAKINENLIEPQPSSPNKYWGTDENGNTGWRKVETQSGEDFIVNLPQKLYGAVGIELNVYFDNIISGCDIDYDFVASCDIGSQYERCYRVTPIASNVGTHTLTIEVTSKNGVTITAETQLIITAENVGSGTTTSVIVLGDSTTDASTPIVKLNENFSTDVMNISTLGTRGTSPNNHEGRSGWGLGTYVGYSSIGSVTNPFYNPTTGVFDASYYFANSGVSVPDWFVINLGTNDMISITSDTQMNNGINTFITRLNTVIASLKSANADMKIGIALTIPPNYSQDAFGKVYKNRWRNRSKKNISYLVNRLITEYDNKENDRVYLIPIYTNLDTVYNMGMEDTQVNARNTTTYKAPIGNGGVHPAESGYWQIADVYYSFLKAHIGN